MFLSFKREILPLPFHSVSLPSRPIIPQSCVSSFYLTGGIAHCEKGRSRSGSLYARSLGATVLEGSEVSWWTGSPVAEHGGMDVVIAYGSATGIRDESKHGTEAGCKQSFTALWRLQRPTAGQRGIWWRQEGEM
jgi:hypothetical protein